MFFADEGTTIDKLDLTKLLPRASHQDKAFYIPYPLIECIKNAITNRNFQQLQQISDASKNVLDETVFPDAVIDQFYFLAVVHQFKPQELTQLLDAFPIDVNKRSIHYIIAGMCRPPEYRTHTLLELAVAYDVKELIVMLQSKKAESKEAGSCCTMM